MWNLVKIQVKFHEWVTVKCVVQSETQGYMCLCLVTITLQIFLEKKKRNVLSTCKMEVIFQNIFWIRPSLKLSSHTLLLNFWQSEASEVILVQFHGVSNNQPKGSIVIIVAVLFLFGHRLISNPSESTLS